jgi:glutamate racemase
MSFIKPIGVFDSGYGGLTILSEIQTVLPNYDYIYLGDNARTPYGNRSFDVVYEFTLQAVEFLFSQGCDLIILACNTASAKALRSIQQNILPKKYPNKRVLGVIRPTSEIIGDFSISKNIGIVATEGTVKSESYLIEIQKFFPEIKVNQLACPIWVPLIENNLHQTEGGKWFIQKDIHELLILNPQIDIILLACTHYPLLLDYIKTFVPANINVISQGKIVAESLKDYLKRHPEIENILTKNKTTSFLTTENPTVFNERTAVFYNKKIISSQVKID